MKEEPKRAFREQMDEMLPDVLVHSVTIDHQQGVVEVTYAELADQADGVGMMKIVALERELFAVEIGEIESDLIDLIDEARTAIRNDDVREERVRRAIARAKGDPGEDDDDELDD